MRPTSSSMLASRSARVAGSRWSPRLPRVLAAPWMPASGVRRSWPSEASRAVRSRWVSSIAVARAACSGEADPLEGEGRLVDQRLERLQPRLVECRSRERMPTTPSRPRTVRRGRKRQSAEGSVLVPLPVCSSWVQAHRAAAQAPSSNASPMAGGSAAWSATSPAASVSTTALPPRPAAWRAISASRSGFRRRLAQARG